MEVGDNVAASAIYQPNVPIKWSAEKVWRVEDSQSRSKDKDDKTWRTMSPRHSSTERSDSKSSRELHSSERSSYRNVSHDRTHSDRSDSERYSLMNIFY